MLEEVAGAEVAQAVQLGLEYAPEPPFNSGRPETAPPEILAQVKAGMEKVKAQRIAEAETAAQAMTD